MSHKDASYSLSKGKEAIAPDMNICTGQIINTYIIKPKPQNSQSRIKSKSQTMGNMSSND